MQYELTPTQYYYEHGQYKMLITFLYAYSLPKYFLCDFQFLFFFLLSHLNHIFIYSRQGVSGNIYL